MASEPSKDLMDLLYTVDKCGKIAKRLIAQGVSANDIKLAVKHKFGVRISNATALKIISAILTVW